jgi:hypothetical protein
VVASYFPHFGEENCLRGWNGSGTIFFSGCNLRCVFCQNHDISWQVQGERVTPARLVQMMLAFQARGCHQLGHPEHVVPQILEALPLAVAGGWGCRSSTTPAPIQGLEPAGGPPLPASPGLCGGGQGGRQGDGSPGRSAGGRL